MKFIVVWSSLSLNSIDRVIPHPKDAAFVAFYLPDENSDELRTQIAVFQASSSTPTSTRFVPFGIRNVVWAPFQRGQGYNFIGLTHTWRVVTFGDSRPILKDNGLAKTVSLDSHHPQRRTIFQDIFGASAFQAESVEPGQSTFNHRKDTNSQIFNDPVYMAPSLDSSFDSFVDSFLVLRPTEVKATLESQEDLVEDDVIMDEGETLPTAHTLRVPTLGEMDTFIHLFKTNCLTGNVNINVANTSTQWLHRTVNTSVKS